MASKYPNYAMLGFDTGFFFLNCLLYTSIGQVILIPQKKEEQTATATQTPTEQTTIQGPVVPKCKDMHLSLIHI